MHFQPSTLQTWSLHILKHSLEFHCVHILSKERFLFSFNSQLNEHLPSRPSSTKKKYIKCHRQTKNVIKILRFSLSKRNQCIPYLVPDFLWWGSANKFLIKMMHLLRAVLIFEICARIHHHPIFLGFWGRPGWNLITVWKKMLGLVWRANCLQVKMMV